MQSIYSRLDNKGRLITAFLHNQPLKQEDIDTLLWFTLNLNPWGKYSRATKYYTHTIGQTGMPFLKGSWPKPFPVLKTMPTPNRSSIGNKVENHYKNLPINKNKKNIFISQRTVKSNKDITCLSFDPA